jgi:hypothetical protein
MKKMFMRNETRRTIKLSLTQMTCVLGIMMLMMLLSSCASSPFVYNIKSNSELKGGKKVLAGRFACFDNDAPVHCIKSGFLIYFNKDGETEQKLFRPDDAGYVYVAVTEGYYNLGRFVKGDKAGSFIFDLETFPVVSVRSDDSVVNFGTLELRFSEDKGSKGDRAQLRVNHIANYDVTRSEIASRVGESAGPIRNGRVEFLHRAAK